MIEKVVIGFTIFFITSIITVLFRLRQLYIVIPKHYRYSSVSENGSVCEIIIYNKSYGVEEDITIALDSNLKFELISSTIGDVECQNSIIKIKRLHKKSEFSLLLLVDKGVIEQNNIISITSKDTKGKILKKIDEVPPNYAMFFLLIVFFIGVIPATTYGIEGYSYLHNKYVESKLEKFYKQGWTNLSKYYSSDLINSYGTKEFPIKYISQKRKDNNLIEFRFELYNKTAINLDVDINTNLSGQIKNNKYYLKYIWGKKSFEIEPMSKKIVVIESFLNDKSLKEFTSSFRISYDHEYLFDIKRKIKIKK